MLSREKKTPLAFHPHLPEEGARQKKELRNYVS